MLRYPPDCELACLDGVVAPARETRLPVDDPAVQHADGVFEVIRVYEGHAFALGEHLQRLARSARNMRLDRKLDIELLEGEVDALLRARGGSGFDGALRIIVSAEGRRLLVTEPLPRFPPCARLALVRFESSPLLDGGGRWHGAIHGPSLRRARS